MRYCIPVGAERDWESPVHGHFGSAPFFAILDTTLPHAVEMVRNDNSHHEHGHCNPVAAVAGLAVDAIVVGGIGMGALQRLHQGGVAVYRCGAGNVLDVAAAIASRTLVAMRVEEACHGHSHSDDGESHCGH